MESANLELQLNVLAQRYGVASLLADSIDPNQYELIQHHERLPAWWDANNNFFLAPKKRKNIGIPTIQLHPGHKECSGFVIIGNEESQYGLLVWGSDGFMYVSANANISGANIALESGCIFVGAQVRHTSRLNLNCRNGGRIALKKDILIASDVSFQTDDCHTLYSIADGTRKNPYGGKIDVEEHVWIGQQAIVMGDCTIGRNSVVGARSFVRGAVFPSNVVLAGSPARVINEGINWDFQDIPPESEILRARAFGNAGM